MLFFDPANNIFGDATISVFAGIAILVGFAGLIVRFALWLQSGCGCSCDMGHARQHRGHSLRFSFGYWINGFSLAAAIVGEFLPAAGPNLIFRRHSRADAGCRVRGRAASIGQVDRTPCVRAGRQVRRHADHLHIMLVAWRYRKRENSFIQSFDPRAWVIFYSCFLFSTLSFWDVRVSCCSFSSLRCLSCSPRG